MINPPSRRQLVYAGLSVALLLISAPISGWLGAQRVARGMTSSKEGVDPTTFVGTFVLAGFRPLAINYLWIKASGLQQRKDHWELRAVYELLSKLQPTNPDVWVFNSWNMSYNISIEMSDPEDAWRWIKAGIDFIQRGRRILPESEIIHAFESQLFFQKIHDQLPALRKRVKQEFGKSALELALEANGRAFRNKQHSSQICLARRGILVRMGRAAVAERGDLPGARRIYDDVDQLSLHIMTHPLVKIYFWPIELRREIVEAAGTAEFTTFGGLREALRDELGRSAKRPADWDRRWDEAMETLDQVARCYRVLGRLMEAQLKIFPEVLRRAAQQADDPWERLLLTAIGARSAQYFNEWLAYCKVQEQTTLARRDYHQRVRKMFLMPRLKQREYRVKVLREEVRRRFGGPLLKAAGELQLRPLRQMLIQRAHSTRF